MTIVNSMNGVTNSGINPSDLGGKLYAALKEPDYLIALMQKALFDSLRYDPDDKRFGDITPNYFRENVQDQLNLFENEVWQLIQNFEKNLERKGIVLFKPEEESTTT